MLLAKHLGRSEPRTIVEKRFVLAAAQTRRWDLLAEVIFQQLPVEKVDIVSLTSFKAVLDCRVAGIRLLLNVTGRLVDVSPPAHIGCLITARKGPAQVSTRATVELMAIDTGETEVTCVAAQEGKTSLAAWALKRLQHDFALKTLDSIETRLRQLCA